MIDQELKKKIVNTISLYELKCDKLQLQIDALKNVINQLVITPVGENSILESQLAQFREQLDGEFDPVALEKTVMQISNLIAEHARQGKKTDISNKINQSLQELLNHLTIPKDLDVKREQVKMGLNQQLNSEDLDRVIDDLTELVVDASNLEQNRFTGFLKQVSTQLQDFDVFLTSTTDARKQSAAEGNQLEHGVQDSIKKIKGHMDNSKTIEELTSKVHKNLEGIGSQIKEYRDCEKNREKDLEEQVQELKLKLTESEQSAEAIKNMLVFQKYKINHDSLTGLPNRGCYDDRILEAFQRYKRLGKELSLAICDIDHFKKINDSFGHLAGDKILKKVADILKSSVREVDFVARIGGEEFAVIFEQTEKKMAAIVLEKLRVLIQDCQFLYRENKVDVTLSFGLASVQEDDDIESIFIRADKAMYNAKNGGRNRVEIL